MRIGDLHQRRLADDGRAGARQVLAETRDRIERAEAGRLLVIAQQNMDRLFQRRAPELRDHRQADGIEALHVGRAAPVEREPARRMANGSDVHAWPSTGTTSVWPESTTPPSRIGPMVAKIAALSPAALGTHDEGHAACAQIILDEAMRSAV